LLEVAVEVIIHQKEALAQAELGAEELAVVQPMLHLVSMD
jgi:hypothetical protein